MKRRWLALPGTQQIGFSADGDWSFPVGTVFVKHFELPVTPTTTRRVETRVLLRQVDRWVGYTYRWNAAQTDATLLTRRGPTRSRSTWAAAPTPADLAVSVARATASAATRAAAGRVLGVRTRAAESHVHVPAAAPTTSSTRGRVPRPLPRRSATPPFYPRSRIRRTRDSIGARARSYLAANCAHCHRPGGPAPGGSTCAPSRCSAR